MIDSNEFISYSSLALSDFEVRRWTQKHPSESDIWRAEFPQLTRVTKPSAPVFSAESETHCGNMLFALLFAM